MAKMDSSYKLVHALFVHALIIYSMEACSMLFTPGIVFRLFFKMFFTNIHIVLSLFLINTCFFVSDFIYA